MVYSGCRNRLLVLLKGLWVVREKRQAGRESYMLYSAEEDCVGVGLEPLLHHSSLCVWACTVRLFRGEF